MEDQGQGKAAGIPPGPPTREARRPSSDTAPDRDEDTRPLSESGFFIADPALEESGNLRLRPPTRRGGLFRLPHVSRAVALPVLTVLFVLGPLLGLLVYEVMEQMERQRSDTRFEDYVRDRAVALEQRTLSIVEALHSLRSFFDCSKEVTRDEFAMFTEDAIARHEGIQAMEWIPCVPEAERGAWRERARTEGLPDFAIMEGRSIDMLEPARGRDVYFPVFFVEPVAGNERAIGYDVACEAIRRTALEKAIRSGEATLTDPVPLVQGQGSILGILGFLPVRERAAADEPDGRGALLGVVCAVLRVDDLLRGTVNHRSVDGVPLMAFDLVDPQTPDGSRVLCRNACEAPWDPSERLPWTHEEAFEVGGQRWALRAAPTEAFLDARHGPAPAFIAGITVLSWFLLCGLLWFAARWARDRDARKQARFVGSVLASLSEGVVVASPKGQIQLSNEAADRLTGMDDEDVSPDAWSQAYGVYRADGVTPYPPDELPLARAMRGETLEEEQVLLRPHDSKKGRWLSITATPLRDEDENTAGGVVVMRDITERKKAEDAILRLSSAVEQTADAVFITDRDARIEYVNPGFEQATGYTRDQVLGRKPNFLKSGVHEEEHYRELWETVLAGRVWRGSTTNRRKDGRVYHTDQTVTPMKDAQGRITHFVSVSKDTTERRKRQEQEYEMRMAAVVQQKLFPEHPPRLEGFDVAGAVLPAHETSGDYYDFVTLEDGRLVLAVGDVSGHGFGPALLMAETRAYLRSLVAAGRSLAETLSSLNQNLLGDLRSEHFVTLLLAALDARTSTLHYANAGHEPGYVLDARGRVKAELRGTGAILGAFEDSQYVAGTSVRLEAGDVVVLLTDGVTEAQSPEGAFFGYRSAVDVVRAHRDRPAREIVGALFAAVRDFSETEARRDDTTVVVCRVLPETT